MSIDVLPDSRQRVATNVIRGGGLNWVPIFCANCGVDGGLVPEENMSFAFYLCDERRNNCAGKLGHLADTMMTSDEAFWQEVNAYQMEKYGRILPGPTIAELIKDEQHPLAKLCKDRKGFK